MTAATLDELAPPLILFEEEVDPAGEMDPTERTQLARARLAEQTAEAEAELARIADRSVVRADDWSWDAILIRVRATAGDAHPLLVTCAAQLVDCFIEAAAMSDVRDVDMARVFNLPTFAPQMIAEAWEHAAERCWQ